MTFDTIGYAPEEHLLLTFDDATLLAHDAQTEAPRWSLALGTPIASVLFVEVDAFPALQSSSPWRQSAAARWVVAIDALGLVHLVDGVAGKVVSTLGPFGPPTAMAAGPGGRFALATVDRVHVWCAGDHAEVPDRATALGFSRDGSTLAVGGADGTLRFLAIAAGTPTVETFCAVVHGGVNDVVQHPNGNWIVAGRQGFFVVSDAGPTRLATLPSTGIRVRLDAKGERLAAQLGERSVAVYAWPQLGVLSRIEYLERPVRGLAWGPQSWLGIGLDHGDGNKVDVVTSATHRTDTHPGRTHRSWVLTVQGPAARLSAKEADDIARMKDPWHVAPAPKNGNAGKIGIGAALTVGLLVLRLVLLAGRSSYHPTYTPPPNLDYGNLGLGTTGSGGTCDASCAKLRLRTLQLQCTDTPCRINASSALAALERNDCAAAKRGVEAIHTFGDPAYGARPNDIYALESARRGLEQACRSSLTPGSHVSLVRLGGKDLDVATESLPFATGSHAPGALWTASDGTVFASTLTGSSGLVYRRDVDSGLWRRIAVRSTRKPVQIWGKSSRSVVLMDHDSLAYWDGDATSELTPPVPNVHELGGMGDDVLVIGDGPAAAAPAATDDAVDDDMAPAPRVLYRHRLTAAGDEWAVESILPGSSAEPVHLWSGGSSVLATVHVKNAAQEEEVRLYQRTAAGRWVERRWGAGPHPAYDGIHAVWVGPKNEIFLGTNRTVLRSTNGGVTFTPTGRDEDELTANGLWGRSASDVFASTSEGVKHWNGKAWSSTGHRSPADAISGNATSVYVLHETADGPDDD